MRASSKSSSIMPRCEKSSVGCRSDVVRAPETSRISKAFRRSSTSAAMQSSSGSKSTEIPKGSFFNRMMAAWYCNSEELSEDMNTHSMQFDATSKRGVKMDNQKTITA